MILRREGGPSYACLFIAFFGKCVLEGDLLYPKDSGKVRCETKETLSILRENYYLQKSNTLRERERMRDKRVGRERD